MRNEALGHIDFNAFQNLHTNSKIIPMDLDMIWERKGKFLVCEWKRPEEKVSKGQEILLKQLSRQENFTVLIIFGWTDPETVIQRFYTVKEHDCRLAGEGLEQLKEYIRLWFTVVEF